MSPTRTDRRGFSRLTAAFLLCVLVALPLAALPPELFGGDRDVCVMACSLDDRDCCCKKAAAHAGSGGSSHGSTATLERPTRLCAELCAALEETRSGTKLLAAKHRVSVDAGSGSRAAEATASVRRDGHDDLATRPRPPPAVSVLLLTR